MGLQDLGQILSVPGRLAYNCTQAGLAQPYPHGGTALGWITDFHAEEVELGAPQRAEELGFAVGWTRGYVSYGVGFTLKQWDPDVLRLFYNVTNAGVNGNSPIISESTPGIVAPILPVIFSPYDLLNPGVIVYAPVPFMGPALRKIGWQIQRPLEIPILFMATYSATNRLIRYGRLDTLTLP